jgi:hypothetical protein
LAGVVPRFSMPDLSAEYRQAMPFGYVELAGIVRRIEWVDQNTDAFDLSGSATGWGLNFSTNIKIGSGDTFRGQALYGQGIQNYMNDAPVDIGIQNNFGDPARPVVGVALPVTGIVAFLDHTWSEKFTSSIGYSSIDIKNSDAQAPSAFHKGEYAVVNLMYYPVKNAMAGVEYQFGNRTNFSDGWTTAINKVQFSFKYNFSQAFYKQ